MDIIETPFGSTRGRELSGCSTNAALTVGKLGYRASFIGRAGRDYKKLIEEKAAEYNVVAYIIEDDHTAGFHLRYLDESLDDRILEIIDVAGKIEEIPEEIYDKSDSIAIAPVLQEVPIEVVREISKQYDGLKTLDVQGFIRRVENGKIIRYRDDRVFEAMRLVEISKPNEHEAKIIFGVEPQIAARLIAKLSKLRIGIVTLDGKGSLLFYERLYKIPAYPVKRPVDPTGCGDVYLGAFTLHFLKTEDPIESAAFASAAASYMVEYIGPDWKMDGIEERFERILERIERVER